MVGRCGCGYLEMAAKCKVMREVLVRDDRGMTTGGVNTGTGDVESSGFGGLL